MRFIEKSYNDNKSCEVLDFEKHINDLNEFFLNNNLSTFEKLICIQECVKNIPFIAYNKIKVKREEADSLYSIFNSLKITNKGDYYATLYEYFCRKLLNKNEVKVSNPVSILEEEEKENVHMNSIICIKDEKYSINGFFCFDAVLGNEETLYFNCVPFLDTAYMNNFNIVFLGRPFVLKRIYLKLKAGEEYEEDFVNDIKKLLEDKNDDYDDIFRDIWDKDLKSNCAVRYYDLLNASSSNDLGEELEILKRELIKKQAAIYDKEMKMYEDLKMSYLVCINFMEVLKLEKELDIICENKDYFEVVEAARRAYVKIKENYPRLERAFEGDDFLNKGAIPLNECFYKLMVEQNIEKLREMNDKQLSKRAELFINYMEKMVCFSYIPLKAYINAYKIIAQWKGMEVEECKSYVFNRIFKEIECAKLIFQEKYCNGCFAKNSIEDLKVEIEDCF